MDAIKLLIVDPNDCFTRSARHYLASWSIVENIDTTGNLSTGLKMARLNKPDILLIDDLYFKDDDDTLHRKLKELKSECPGLEIIALTLYEENIKPANLLIRQNTCRIIAKENFAQGLARELKKYKPQYQNKNPGGTEERKCPGKIYPDRP